MATRQSAKIAFDVKGHSLVTPDIIDIGISGENGVVSTVYIENDNNEI